MAAPCNQFIVARGVEIENLGAHGGDPHAPAVNQFGRMWRPLPVWVVGKEPHGSAKKVGVAQNRAATLLARHGMAGKKRRAFRRVEEASSGGGDLRLGAAHVGNQMLAAKDAGELIHIVERRVDGHGQQHYLALSRYLQWVGGDGIYSAHGERSLRAFRASIPSGDGTVKACRSQRQTY